MRTQELTVVEYTALFDYANSGRLPSRPVKRRLLYLGALVMHEGELRLTISALDSLVRNAPRSPWSPPKTGKAVVTEPGVVPEVVPPEQRRGYHAMMGAAASMILSAAIMGVPPGRPK